MKNFFATLSSSAIIFMVALVSGLGVAVHASTITTIQGSDTITASRGTINTNFSNLNTDKLESGNTAAALTITTLTSTAASTTRMSCLGSCAFGATATSTFSSAGVLTLATALGIASGGTASSTSLGGILVGNGTSAIKSLAIGSGLTFNGTTLATSGAGITALGPVGQTQTGGTQTLATSTSAYSGLTSALTIVGSGDTQTFTPSLSGTLTVAGGGTGIASLTASQLLTGNGTSAMYGTATSSLAVGTGLTSSGTLGAQVGGTASSISFAAIAANSLWANITGASAVPTVTATSSLYTFTGTGDSVRAISPALTGSATFANLSGTNATSTGTLTIPNSSSQTPVAAGQIAFDTTDNQLKLGDGSITAVIPTFRNYSFGYATTSWVGTTTSMAAPFTEAGTIKNLVCTTSSGTVGVDWYYGPTPTHLAYIPTASTTANVNTFSSNNTPGAYASSTVAFGTPSASTITSVSCTAKVQITGT